MASMIRKAHDSRFRSAGEAAAECTRLRANAHLACGAELESLFVGQQNTFPVITGVDDGDAP